MSTIRTRLSSTRPLLAVLGYAVAVVVLLAMAWSGIADILDRRQSVTAASDLLAQPPKIEKVEVLAAKLP